ncbi:MAG: hypothetical protein ACRBCL_03465 [Maritimibacter sp.]
MTPVITRSTDCETGEEALRAEAIALALMGVGALEETLLVEGASWQGANDAPVAVGRSAIQDACSAIRPARAIAIEQIITQGAAGSVAGRLRRDGEGERLFCHVIRFTNSAANQIAQLVSFEHGGAANV